MVKFVTTYLTQMPCFCSKVSKTDPLRYMFAGGTNRSLCKLYEGVYCGSEVLFVDRPKRNLVQTFSPVRELPRMLSHKYDELTFLHLLGFCDNVFYKFLIKR